jgi:hypothetical protein
MFEIGDKVVCTIKMKADKIKEGSIYTIGYSNGVLLSIKGISDDIFYSFQFESLLKIRKEKIKKICSKLETK